MGECLFPCCLAVCVYWERGECLSACCLAVCVLGEWLSACCSAVCVLPCTAKYQTVSTVSTIRCTVRCRCWREKIKSTDYCHIGFRKNRIRSEAIRVEEWLPCIRRHKSLSLSLSLSNTQDAIKHTQMDRRTVAALPCNYYCSKIHNCVHMTNSTAIH